MRDSSEIEVSNRLRFRCHNDGPCRCLGTNTRGNLLPSRARRGFLPRLNSPKDRIDSDRQLLIDLYYDMGGQNWKSAYTTYSSKWGYETERRSMNWLSSAPIGSWEPRHRCRRPCY